MRTLALVPCRQGSKGVPGKNTRAFHGLSLVEHAIKVGMVTCDRTVVTTDSREAEAIAIRYGLTVVMRPPELAQDDSPMLPVVQHALMAMGDPADVVVLLQPTSPNPQRVAFVREALHRLQSDDYPSSVVSMVEIPERFRPDYAVRLTSDRWMAPLTSMGCRQAAREAFYRDGTVYAIRRATIEAGDLYGPKSAPLFLAAADSVTIDTEADWREAEARLG